jgi:predicted MFS family arabinose efflux permease
MGLFWALNAVAFALVHSLGIVLPSMTEDLALTPIDSGWLGSSYFLLICLMSVLMSSWLSRYEPNRVVMLSALVASVLIFAQGWAPDFAIAMAARVGFVVMVIARMSVGPLLIQRWFPPQRLSLVNSIAMVTMDASLAIAMAVLPFIMDLLQGWRNTYYAFGLLSLLVSLVWVAFGRGQPKPEYTRAAIAQERSPLRAILRYKEVWLLGIGVFGGTAVWSAFSTFWPTYVTSVYGVPLTGAGLVLGLGSVGAVIGYLVCSSLAERIGRRKPIILVAGVALPLLNVATLWTGSMPALAALSLVRGFTWMFLPIVMTVPYELPNIKPREVAVATALIMTLMAAGGALGPLLAGFLAKSLDSLYFALAPMCALPITLSIAGLLLPETGRVKREMPKAEQAG